MKRILFLFVVLALCCSALMAQNSTYRWVKTHTFTGTGVQNTPAVKFFGTKWRFSYSAEKAGKIRIYKHTLNDDDDPKGVLLTKDASGHDYNSSSSTDCETCYFTVKGEGKAWSLTIEEYLDVSREWQYLQSEKKTPADKWRATYAGSEGNLNTTIIEEHNGGISHIDFTLAEDGTCEVSVITPAKRYAFHDTLTKKGFGGSAWIYQPGPYKIKIKSDVPWTAEVYDK